MSALAIEREDQGPGEWVKRHRPALWQRLERGSKLVGTCCTNQTVRAELVEAHFLLQRDKKEGRAFDELRPNGL